MELIDYIHILRRRWVLIALVVIACVGGAAAATKLTTPTYQATSRLIINGPPVSSTVDAASSNQLAVQNATTFADLIATTRAVQAALDKAEATAGPFKPSGSPSVTASADGTDPFITITVTDTDPRRAAAVANAIPLALPELLSGLQQSATTHEIEVLQTASIPTTPISPKPRDNLIIGLALGLVLGIAAAFVVETLDRRLKDSADVEEVSGLTVLGVVPLEKPKILTPADTHPRSARAEAYRQVRTNLAFASEKGPPKTVIVTSSVDSEGKTSLAVNLAITSARAGQRVVLVDADLRRPMVHTLLGMPEHKGLVHVLAGTIGLSDALQSSQAGPMDVLVSGPLPTNPSELVGSETMLKTIRQLESSYDVVIIDSPPVLPVTDALLIAVHADAVVVVARLGQITRDRMRRTTTALEQVNASVAGVVPNGAIEREDSAYHYAYRDRSGRRPTDILHQAKDPDVAIHPAFRTNANGNANANANANANGNANGNANANANGIANGIANANGNGIANANGNAPEPSSEPAGSLVRSEGTIVDVESEPRGKHAPRHVRREEDAQAPPPQD